MNVSRKAGIFLVLVLGVANVASAQEAQNPPPPPPVQTPVKAPTTPPPATTSTPSADAALIPIPLSISELRRRREAIDAMEGMLPTKVKAAAKDTMREMEAVQQAAVNLFTNSSPRARGFHLEGYGVFFYVEIPGVRASVASAFEQLQKSRLPLDRVDRGTASRAAENATPLAFDANASYTDAVKRQLVDAMLDYSQPLDLRPDEWLTIAARDGDEPIPNVIYESITMVVRARGSDLADFRAGRLTREQMLKRVELRGF